MVAGLGSFDERSLHVATGFGATHSVALYTVRGTGWPERFPLTTDERRPERDGRPWRGPWTRATLAS